MVPEAPLEQTENGLAPKGDGWFVVNARETPWWHLPAGGSAVTFEGDPRFPELGINIHVVRAGEPNGMYHGENSQENFLVLSGRCLLVIEGQERELRQWDFVHCPPWTEHIFVGLGDEPCAILMAGSRPEGFGREVELRYPVNEVAAKHDASVLEETAAPKEAYARFPRPELGPYREGDLPG